MQIASKTRGVCTIMEHLGSAHDDAQLAVLVAIARERIAELAGKVPLDLDGLGAAPPRPRCRCSSPRRCSWSNTPRDHPRQLPVGGSSREPHATGRQGVLRRPATRAASRARKLKADTDLCHWIVGKQPDCCRAFLSGGVTAPITTGRSRAWLAPESPLQRAELQENIGCHITLCAPGCHLMRPASYPSKLLWPAASNQGQRVWTAVLTKTQRSAIFSVATLQLTLEGEGLVTNEHSAKVFIRSTT